MPPVGSLHEPPPLAPIAQAPHRRRRHEHERARIDHVRQRAGIILRIGHDLGQGRVTGRLDEGLELPVRHRRAVDPEAVDRHAMDRRFLRIVAVGPHAKGAAGNPDHVVGSAIVRRKIVALGIGIQQRHVAHSRRTLLRTDVPETLGPAWIGVVPAIAGRRRRTGPCRGGRGRHKPDRGARGDRTARTPVIVRRTHPTARTCDTGTHHGPPRCTTVRLATLPRGPTTVVRRAAPPRRTAISIMEPACLSSPCSSSCGPATSARGRCLRQDGPEHSRTDCSAECP